MTDLFADLNKLTLLRHRPGEVRRWVVGGWAEARIPDQVWIWREDLIDAFDSVPSVAVVNGVRLRLIRHDVSHHAAVYVRDDAFWRMEKLRAWLRDAYWLFVYRASATWRIWFPRYRPR